MPSFFAVCGLSLLLLLCLRLRLSLFFGGARSCGDGTNAAALVTNTNSRTRSGGLLRRGHDDGVILTVGSVVSGTNMFSGFLLCRNVALTN